MGFQEPIKDKPDDENVPHLPLEMDMEVFTPSRSEYRFWRIDKVRPDLQYKVKDISGSFSSTTLVHSVSLKYKIEDSCLNATER